MIALMLGLPWSACAEIVAAKNAKAITYHDVAKARLEYNRRTLIGAYEAVGSHNEKWNDQAKAFLEQMAIYFSLGALDARYRPMDPLTHDQLGAMTNRLYNTGCDDPLVKYCVGSVLHDSLRTADAARLVPDLVEQMAQRKYPPHRVASAAARTVKLMAWQRDAAGEQRFRKVLADALAQVVSSKADESDLRWVWQALESEFEALPPDMRGQICDAGQKSTEHDPWLLNIFRGTHEIKLAWEARGHGFANTVTEEGWRLFFEHMAKAKDYLVKAHEARPQFPEAAAKLIGVATAAGSRLDITERDWFDKATAAQFDFAPAYDVYVGGLYPRWGGSHEKMFRFGIECAQTERFDTSVPDKLLTIVKVVNLDSSNDFAVYAIPEVSRAIAEHCAKAEKAAKTQLWKDYYASYQVAAAWRAQDYKRAAELLDSVGARLTQAPFEQLRGWSPGALSEVRAMTSHLDNVIVRTEKSAADGKIDAAIDAFNKIANNLGKDHPGYLHVIYRAKALQTQKDFAAGKPIVVNSESLAPWASMYGEFKFQPDGTIHARADANGRALLLCRAELGDAYEISATVLAPPDQRARGIATIVAKWWELQRLASTSLNWSKGSFIVSGGGRMNERPLQLKGGERLTLRIKDETFTAFLDGQQTFPSMPLDRETPKDAFAGFGIMGTLPNMTAAFRDVEIRKIAP
jgi:hypothetical protein